MSYRGLKFVAFMFSETVISECLISAVMYRDQYSVTGCDVKFEVLTVLLLKIQAFLDVTLLGEWLQCFEESQCLYLQVQAV